MQHSLMFGLYVGSYMNVGLLPTMLPKSGVTKFFVTLMGDIYPATAKLGTHCVLSVCFDAVFAITVKTLK